MIVPTIHLNGTGRAELIRQLLDARIAIADAIEAVRNAAPNGRDYYPQGPDALGAALTEHQLRINRLRALLDEVEQLACHIYDSPGPK